MKQIDQRDWMQELAQSQTVLVSRQLDGVEEAEAALRDSPTFGSKAKRSPRAFSVNWPEAFPAPYLDSSPSMWKRNTAR